MVGFVTARGDTDVAASPILDPRRRRGETPFGQAFASYRAALEREDQAPPAAALTEWRYRKLAA